MTSSSVQGLFAAAERAFVERSYSEARRHLIAVEQCQLRHPVVYHLRALVERELGDFPRAQKYFEAATQLAPHDPQIANNFGNLLGDMGDEAAALAAYDRALRLAPDFPDAALNRAITLYRLKLYAEARAALRALAAEHAGDVRIWNALAAVEKDVGEAAAAAAAFDRALEISPTDAIALQGRARMSLERAEDDVFERYAAALTVAPDEPQLIFEQTDARLAAGDEGALQDFAAFVHQRPAWTYGQIELARMLWENRRDETFADHVKALLRKEPGRRDLWTQLVSLLAGTGHYSEATDAAHDAWIALGGDPKLMLLEAVHAGRAGDIGRAETIFASLPVDLPGRAAHESVHRIRQDRLKLAKSLIDGALAENPADIGSWAVAELIYRKVGDERADWLSRRDGLVQASDLALDPESLETIKALLLRLHSQSRQRVGQSVRSGTQTRWRLFDRTEPEIAELRSAIECAIQHYVAALPPEDERHPLLRHRHSALAIVGSWSIRLSGSGYHVSHIHPEGLISSACYFEVPASAASSQEGRLELGRPPRNLLLDLEPLHVVTPRPGRLVLFPSYLHHGTRPFTSGERLTVAFDVNRHLAPDG